MQPSILEGFREFFHREPEPVLESLKRGWAGMANDLNFSQWQPPLQLALKALIIVLALGAWPVWLACLVAYIAYRFFRVFVQVVTDAPGAARRSDSSAPGTAPLAQAAAAPPAGAPVWNGPDAAPIPATPVATVAPLDQRPGRRRRRRGQATWRFAAYSELAAQPARLRAAGLLASLLAAAAIAPVATLLTFLFTTHNQRPEVFLWAAIVATLASWTIMIPGQLSEGRIEDQAPLRFGMLLLGAIVGMVAWVIAQAMFVSLPNSHDIGLRPGNSFSSEFLGWRDNALEEDFNRGFVNLPLPMYTAYFACLFVVLRWWRMAEWTRSSRVSVWATAWAAFVGFVVGLFWWFPQPLGILTAAVIAFTVQLASPWLPPRRRREMAQKVA